MADETLDCSDIDRYLGKPMQPARLKEPLANNDIRRWVQAMHYPNRLHYEDEFAAASRFGGIVAPQSFPVATDDGHGTAPSCIGRIPQSHMIFGGDEWWFYGPRIVAGDLIHNERIPLDYAVKQTKFAGRPAFNAATITTTTIGATRSPHSDPPAFAIAPRVRARWAR